MVSNIMFEIENAQLSESSSEVEKKPRNKEPKVKQLLQTNETTAKLKQKIIHDLANKKDTTPDGSQSPTPIMNKLAAAVEYESKEELEAKEKARSIKVLNHKLKKVEQKLDDLWFEIKNTKQERMQVFKQKASLQSKVLKGTSVGSNMSNSSIIKKINAKLEHDFLQAI